MVPDTVLLDRPRRRSPVRPCLPQYEDPVVYEVLWEAANVLRGEYLALARCADTQLSEQQWMAKVRAVTSEVETVDMYDEQAVRAKVAELSARIKAIRAR